MLGFDRLRIFGVPTVPYFRLVASHLRRSGCAIVETRVPPTGSIAIRGEALAAELKRHLGERPCHIIAHSMGGLDARFLITHLEHADRIISLTTLGTPHRGSTLADIVLRGRPSALVRLARLVGLTTDGAADLRLASMQRFNEQTPDLPQVRYFSLAATKPIREMDLVLRRSARVLQRAEGPSDGLVSVSSAAWGERQEVWRGDHLDLIGWHSPVEGLLRRARDPRPLYTALAQRLAALEAER